MKKRLAALCAMVFAASAAFAQADIQPLVKIKNEQITLKNLKARCAVYQKQTGMESFSLDEKKEILTAMIDEKLFVQAAAKAGMTLTDTQVNQLFESSLSQMVGQQVSEAQFATLVRQNYNMSLDEFFQSQTAMSVAEYKTYIKNQYISQQYVISLYQNELENITATDTEVRSWYELNKASLYQPDTLKVFMTIAPKNENALNAQKLLMEEYDALKNGALTLDGLRVHVASKSPLLQGDDVYLGKNAIAASQLGITESTLLSMFQAAPGSVSDFKDSGDYYSFFVIQDTIPGKILGLSDVVQPGSNITVYEYIRSQLAAQKQQEVFTEAVSAITTQLRTPENYQMLKTGSALDKLLENW